MALVEAKHALTAPGFTASDVTTVQNETTTESRR